MNNGEISTVEKDRVQVIAKMSVDEGGIMVDGEKVDPNKPIKSVNFIGSITVGGGIKVSQSSSELDRAGSVERKKTNDPRMFSGQKISEHQPLMQSAKPAPVEESCSCRIL